MNNDKMMKCVHVHEKDRMYDKTHETQHVLNMKFYPKYETVFVLSTICLSTVYKGGILY